MLRKAVVAAVLLGSLGAVAAAGDTPRFEARPPGTPAPRVALVLGSGGHRGFAHIGALKALEEGGVKPDLIIGSSIGAVVGALYASGTSAAQLEEHAYKLSIFEFLEPRTLIGMAATGRGTQHFVNRQLNGRLIEELPIPFAAAATRVRDNALVLFNRGDTGMAVRASAANPDGFEPVEIGGETYLDGDEVSPVPIRAARNMGARVVIAIDVSAYLKSTPASAPAKWIEKDKRRAKQIAAEAPGADVMIHPDIGYYAGRSESYRRRVIDIAYRFTRDKLPLVKAAIAKAK